MLKLTFNQRKLCINFVLLILRRIVKVTVSCHGYSPSFVISMAYNMLYLSYRIQCNNTSNNPIDVAILSFFVDYSSTDIQ